MTVAFPRASGASPLDELKRRTLVAKPALGFASEPLLRSGSSQDQSRRRSEKNEAATPSVSRDRAGKPAPASSNWNPFRFLFLRRPIPSIVFRFAGEKRLPLLPLHVIFTTLKEQGVSEIDVPRRLEAAAADLASLRSDNLKNRRGPARIAASAAKALSPIDAGNFDEARRAFAQGREAARKLRDESSLYEAELLAQEARVDHLQLNYRGAAEKFAHAAFLVSPFDADRCKGWLFAQADEFLEQGTSFHDKDALAQAIALYRRYIELAPQNRHPHEWAAARSKLGLALRLLGEQENDAEMISEAVAAFRDALSESPQEQAPEEWAATQAQLGLALLRLAERSQKPAQFSAAAAAFRAALSDTPRSRAPLDWAALRHNLGAALLQLGERYRDLSRIEEAAAAFRDALEERPREIFPLDWAATQHSLGVALFRLAENESGTKFLPESVAAFCAALAERRRERGPLDWAATQNSLGLALLKLGERKNEAQKLEEAIGAFRAALSERMCNGDSSDCAETKNNLGLALLKLADFEGGTDSLEEAVSVFRGALSTLAEKEREHGPSDWAVVKNNLSLAIYRLEKRSGRTECLDEAIHDYRNALEDWTREVAPFWNDPR